MTPPTLTAAVGANVDGAFDITFPDDATWRAAIASITAGGTTLSSSAYSVSAGKITFTPSASTLLQTSGTRSIAVSATGYTDATVLQLIGFGAAAKLGITTQPTAPAANGGALAAQPAVAVQDQYGNTVTTSSATVTAAVGSGNWTLGGTLSVATFSGVAAFSGLTASSAAAVSGATIGFTCDSFTPITSSGFNIPAPAPPNDLCVNATALALNPTTPTSGTMAGATVTTPFSGNDVWYTVTPSVSGTLIITTATTSQDLNTYIWSGSCPAANNGSIVAATTPSTLTGKSVSVSVTAGTVYTIRIMHYSGTSGSVAGPFTIAATMPLITLSGTLAPVDTTYGTVSASPTSFTVTGAGLTGNLSVALPTGFEASLASDSGYASPLALTATSGSVGPAAIYVRLAATTAYGTYSGNITVSGGSATSKTIATASSSVAKKAITIIGINAVDKTYDGNANAPLTGTAAYFGLVDGESFPVSGTPVATFDSPAAGQNKPVNVTGYSAPSANYSVTPPSLTANINQKPLTVTANNVIKPYGTALNSPVTGSTAFTSSGLVSGETIGSVTITYADGAAADAAAGTYTGAVVPSAPVGGSFSTANYNISYVNGDLTVNASPTISANGTLSALSTTYGTASANTSFSVSGGFLTGDPADVTVTAPAGFEISTSPDSGFGSSLVLTATGGNVSETTIYVRLPATAAAGTHSGNITVTGGGAPEQDVPTASSTISKKALTITGLTANPKEYNRTTTANVTGTAAYSGTVNSESFTVADSITWSYADKAVGTAKPLTASANYSAPSDNYTVTQPTLSADITAKVLTVSDATAASKDYDGTATATITGTLVGVIDGDTVYITGGGAFADANVANGIAVTAKLNLSGSDAGNYALTQPTGLTANITKAAQTITFPATLTKTTADPAYDAGATASSGLTVSYSSSNPSVATVAGSTVTLVGAGTTTITATQPGSANYKAATPATQTLTVTLTDAYTVNFEGSGETKTGYASGNVTLSGISWNLTDALIGNLSGDRKNGSASARLQSTTGVMTMLADKANGAGTISMKYANYGSDTGNSFKVDYSTDGGITWTPAGSPTSVNSTTLTPFSATVNVVGPVRIKITKTAGSNRMNIDDISITSFSAPVIASVGTPEPFTTMYGTASAAQSFSISAASLTTDLVASAPTGFEVSSDGASYSPTATFTQSGGSTTGTLYVRLAASAAAGTHDSQNVVLSSGAGSLNITTASSGNTVTPRTVAFTGSKPYDRSAILPAANLTILNKVGTDDITLTGSVTLDSANGGPRTISDASGLSLSGAAQANYTLPGTASDLRINPAVAEFSFATTRNKAVTFDTSRLLAYGSDAGVTLSLSGIPSSTAHGSLQLNGTSLTYTPATDFSGPDIFHYNVDDNLGGSTQGTVNITVNDVNALVLSISQVNGVPTVIASGIPGRAYDLQARDDAQGSWNFLTTVTADAHNGVIIYQDTDYQNHSSRMFRLAQPAQ